MILKLTREHLENLYSEMGDNDVLVIDTNEEAGKELSLEKVVKSYISLSGTKESWVDRFAEAAVTSTLKEAPKVEFSDKEGPFTERELIALAKAQTVVDSENYYKERPLLDCTKGKKIHTLIGTSVNKGKESDDYLVKLFDKGVKEGLLTNHD